MSVENSLRKDTVVPVFPVNIYQLLYLHTHAWNSEQIVNLG